MASKIAEHTATIESLKDLPSKFDQMMEMLTTPTDNERNENNDNESSSNNDDIVSNLISKSTTGMFKIL
jgi:hypothetical protein